MHHNVLFVGREYRDDLMLQRYALRHIKSAIHRIDTIYFFDESDKGLFLHLEKLVQERGSYL